MKRTVDFERYPSQEGRAASLSEYQNIPQPNSKSETNPKQIRNPSKIRNPKSEIRNPSTAFTLIELLIVIAIIAILASLVFPVVGAINKKKQISRAQTELQALAQAIEGYHTKLGFYPPDNPNNPITNLLYFELLGTTNDGVPPNTPQNFGTLDGSAQISTTLLNQYFNVQGLANTSTRAKSDDRGAAASTFLTHLLPAGISVVDTGQQQIKILVCGVTWPTALTPLMSAAPPGTNPWRYVSTHPTNNTASFDLWVDVVIKGKTNRVSNWNAQPIQL
jgi:prepilin-type N-terminal cleavage/methylation domain-containing protein